MRLIGWQLLQMESERRIRLQSVTSSLTVFDLCRWGAVSAHRGLGSRIMQLENREKVLERRTLGYHGALNDCVRAPARSKIRVTSGFWDGEKVILKDQVLELRMSRAAPRSPASRCPMTSGARRSSPMGRNGPGVIADEALVTRFDSVLAAGLQLSHPSRASRPKLSMGTGAA
jgi:hypothetical protein